MNQLEAKGILRMYRPGTSDANDPRVTEALACAQRDPELQQWLEQQARLHQALQTKFRAIPVPADLKDKILAHPKIISPGSWWRDPGWLRAVAVIIVFIGLSQGLLHIWTKSRVPDGFADYKYRMVRSALREYRMDLVTSDLQQVRALMAQQSAPADFSVPEGLAKLTLTGGGVLRWRNNPVSMICFNRGDDQMLFLFVMNRAAVDDPPTGKPELSRVSKLQTISWSEGNKAYLLAGPRDGDPLQKYF